MTLGLFVEGPSDKDTIPVLIKKFFPKIRIIPQPLHSRGEMFSGAKIMTYVRFLLRRHKDIKKVLVCIDTHCNPKDIRQKVNPIEQELKGIGIRIKYSLIIHALESWLMEDKGLRKVLGERAKIDLPNNLEEICEPEKMLRNIFRKNGKSYQKTRYAPQIAEAIDGKIVRRKSRNFDEFCKAVQDC